MQITFDTTNKQDLAILDKIFAITKTAQPEVAHNTGTTAVDHSSLPSAGSGVSEGAASVTAESVEAAPAPEKKERKPRAKKEEAAAQVEKQETAAPVETAPSASAEVSEDVAASSTDAAKVPAASSTPISLDEVRAALQQFTAAKGVPAGIELLKKFGAGRISELEAGDYSAFVLECAA